MTGTPKQLGSLGMRLKNRGPLFEPPSYLGEPVYRYIRQRLYARHRIDLFDHVQTIKKVSHLYVDGIDFIANDHKALMAALAGSSFEPDNKSYLCDAVASAATAGQGYRELGVPSLHCQISKGRCNIHVDSYGFVSLLNGKKVYNPDAIQHIIDELGWAFVVAQVKKVDPGFGKLLEQTHVIVANSKNRYAPVAGGSFEIGEKKPVGRGMGWALAFEYTYAFAGSRKGETKKMVTLTIDF